MSVTYVMTTGTDNIVKNTGRPGDAVVVANPGVLQVSDLVDLRRPVVVIDNQIFLDRLLIQSGGSYAINQAGAPLVLGIEWIIFRDLTASVTFAYGGNPGLSDERPVWIDAGGGNDFIAATTVPGFEGRIAVEVSGAAGADTVIGGRLDDKLYGDAGYDHLFGWGGADLIWGGPGGAFISGGDGDDIILAEQGNDSIDAGAGNDWINGGANADADTILGGDGADTLLANGTGDRFEGGSGNDVMIGVVYTDDPVFSFTGRAIFIGGAGADSLLGDTADDWMLSTDALDRFANPGFGNDLWQIIGGFAVTWNGQWDNDTLIAPNGGATFVGEGGNDVMVGGAGADSFAGGASDDLFVELNGGADTVEGAGGADTVHDGPGSMVFLGGDGHDLFVKAPSLTRPIDAIQPLPYVGGALALAPGGADTFFGGTGNDTYRGGAGRDLFLPGAGSDLFLGEGGDDRVVMALQELEAGDTLEGGSGGTDVLALTATVGDALRPTTILLPRSLTVTGLESLELALAGTPLALRWVLPEGAFWAPHILFTGVSETVDARAGTAPLNLVAGDGNDTVFGGTAADRLEGGTGNDRLTDGAGSDLLLGGDGADSLDGGAGHDSLYGDAGSDRLRGGDGNDLLNPGSGADSVLGGAGDDSVVVLLAELDIADLLAGGAGIDDLSLIATGLKGLTLEVAERLSGFERISVNADTPGLVLRIGDGLAESAAGGLVVQAGGAAGITLDATAVTERGVDLASLLGGTLLGGAGDDSLASGIGPSVLNGALGNDRMTVGLGAATVLGGAGDEVVRMQRDLSADDSLDGGMGADTLTFAAPVLLLPGDFARVRGFETVQLADALNEITFGAADLPRNPVQLRILGGGQADVVDAALAQGAVAVAGAAGDDVLIGSARGDSLDGGSGADVIAGGGGNDVIALGDLDGDDVVDGGIGVDRLVLDLTGQRAASALFTGITGFESLDVTLTGGRLALPSGLTAAPPVFGGPPAFQVTLTTAAGALATLDLRGATASIVAGGEGNELLLGSRGADSLAGGLGDDTILGGRGGDRLDLGGGGADLLRYTTVLDGATLGTRAAAGTADTIAGFGAEDRIELSRAAFGGLPQLTRGVTVQDDAPVPLGRVSLLFLAAGDMPGNPLDLAAVNAAFGARLLANGATGDASFLLVAGTEAGTGVLYYVRDGNDNTILDTADTVLALAWFADGLPVSADQFVIL